MLKSLEIRNYQSHRSALLSFHHGMNVITGTSDSGKSAVIRAMLWALKNRPSGESFKSWKAKADDSVEVSMEFDNDWFTKSRTNGKNRYETDDGFYEALRHDVPQPIQDIANINDYNLQTQFQPYFMLQDTPGERAKKLNELVGLDIIDRVFKKLGSKSSAAKQQIKAETERLNQAINDLTKFEHLPSVELKIDSLMKDCNKRDKLIGEQRTASELASKIADYDEQIRNKSILIKAEKFQKDLQKRISVREGLFEKHKELVAYCGSLLKADEQLEADTDWLKVEAPFLLLKPKVAELQELNKSKKALESIILALEQAETSIEEFEETISAKVVDYVDKIGKAGVCPTCKSKIDKSVVAKILKELQE